MGDEEFLRLRKLYDYAVLDTEPEPNFDRLAWIASRVFKTPIATLSLADAERHWFKARVGVEGREMPRRMSFCNETIRGDQVFVVSDARADARFVAAPVVTGAPWVRFYAGAPLIAPGGFRVGSLCVSSIPIRAMILPRMKPISSATSPAPRSNCSRPAPANRNSRGGRRKSRCSPARIL